jgi:hypothetical protein
MLILSFVSSVCSRKSPTSFGNPLPHRSFFNSTRKPKPSCQLWTTLQQPVQCLPSRIRKQHWRNSLAVPNTNSNPNLSPPESILQSRPAKSSHYTEHGTASSLRSAITRNFKPDSRDKGGLAISPPVPPEYTLPSPDPEDSRMVDEDSRNLVRDMPFRVDRKFHIRAYV